MESLKEIFGEVISSYTREDAINDGVLIDISNIPVTKEIGMKVPAAITQALWNGQIKPNKHEEDAGQSIDGRLWDLLYMWSLAIKRKSNNGKSEARFEFFVWHADGKKSWDKSVIIKSQIHPGDNGEAVLTFMLPNED